MRFKQRPEPSGPKAGPGAELRELQAKLYRLKGWQAHGYHQPGGSLEEQAKQIAQIEKRVAFLLLDNEHKELVQNAEAQTVGRSPRRNPRKSARKVVVPLRTGRNETGSGDFQSDTTESGHKIQVALEALQSAGKRTAGQAEPTTEEREALRISAKAVEQSELPEELKRNFAETLRRSVPQGYRLHGNPGRCIFSAMPANELDHTPSVAYVNGKGGKNYGGRKLLLPIDATINRHKAAFPSECLHHIAERMKYRLSVTKAKDPQRPARIAGLELLWPSDGREPDQPCPCIKCQRSTYQERRAQIMRDPITTAPTPGRKAKL